MTSIAHDDARILKGGGAPLSSASPRAVAAALDASGMVALRDFAADLAQFDALAHTLSERAMPAPNRAPFPDHPCVHPANETGLPLAPHADHGTRPERLRPIATWFYCAVPSERDGETTLFDGTRVWSCLSPAARGILAERPILYTTRVRAEAWQAVAGGNAEMFCRHVRALGGTPTLRQDGDIDVAVTAPAVGRTRAGAAPAFVSSVSLAGTPGFESITVAFADGSAIPRELLGELRAALDECCELWPWRAGDVLVLDNSRFVHGRRGYDDRRRKLYLFQTLSLRLPTAPP